MDYTWMYFSTTGRISRKQFWVYNLLLTVPYLLAVFASFAFLSEETANLVAIALNIAVTWPQIAVSAKRWHDRGKSAWWILIGFVPLIGGIWSLIETGVRAGEEDDNYYGPSPLVTEPATLIPA